MEHQILTPSLHQQLVADGYQYLESLGSVEGEVDPGASTAFLYRPLKEAPAEGTAFDDISSGQILQMVNEDIDLVEIYITTEY